MSTKKKTKRLTASEKRVLIAKDTVKWLNADKIKATKGTYCKLTFSKEKLIQNKEKLDVILKGQVIKPCKVCGLGGMFYSMVRRFDNITVDVDHTFYGKYFIRHLEYGNDTIYSQLGKYFSKDQLELIESAFEQRDMFAHQDLPDNYNSKYNLNKINTVIRATNFGLKFNAIENKARLRAIMNNIIRNDGVFIP